MISNVSYIFSIFSDYGNLSYNQDDVEHVLTKFKEHDIDFVPLVFNEEINPTNTVKRMHFYCEKRFFLLAINSDRISFSFVSAKKQGFSSDEICCMKELLLESIKLILDLIEERTSLPNRLSWCTSYINFELNENEKVVFRKKFLKDIPFFENSSLDELVARYGANRIIKIKDNEEKLNVIMTIARNYFNFAKEKQVEGYKIDYDINTWQGNKKGRFDLTNIKEFIVNANSIQNELSEEVLS